MIPSNRLNSYRSSSRIREVVSSRNQATHIPDRARLLTSDRVTRVVDGAAASAEAYVAGLQREKNSRVRGGGPLDFDWGADLPSAD